MCGVEPVGQRIAQRIRVRRRHVVRDPRQVHAVGVGVGEGSHVGGPVLQGEGGQAIVEIIACCGYKSTGRGSGRLKFRGRSGGQNHRQVRFCEYLHAIFA
jgi:hypothetical protein